MALIIVLRRRYISMLKQRVTHITFTNLEEFLSVLSSHCGDKIVNDIMMDNDYVFSFLDELANIYFRLSLKTFEEHSEALRRIVERGYLVVVV